MARLFNYCIIFVLLTTSGCVPDVPDDGDPMEKPLKENYEHKR